jgi:hypothetical protein
VDNDQARLGVNRRPVNAADESEQDRGRLQLQGPQDVEQALKPGLVRAGKHNLALITVPSEPVTQQARLIGELALCVALGLALGHDRASVVGA